jgi:hypothetical protein
MFHFGSLLFKMGIVPLFITYHGGKNVNTLTMIKKLYNLSKNTGPGGCCTMTHIHLAALGLTLALFFIVSALYSAKKNKIGTILHQVLRVTYLFVIMTGFILLPMMPFSLGRISKVALGLLTIGVMEIVLAHQIKGHIKGRDWLIFMVILLVTIFTGLLLPLGLHLFT